MAGSKKRVRSRKRVKKGSKKSNASGDAASSKGKRKRTRKRKGGGSGSKKGSRKRVRSRKKNKTSNSDEDDDGEWQSVYRDSDDEEPTDGGGSRKRRRRKKKGGSSRKRSSRKRKRSGKGSKKLRFGITDVVGNDLLVTEEAMPTKQDMKMIDNLVDQYPQDPRVYNKRAKMHVLMNQNQLALNDWATAIHLQHPPRAVYYLNRGYFYEKLGLYAQALDDLDMSIQLGPKPERMQAAYYFRGRVLRKLGETDLARKDLETALLYEGTATDRIHKELKKLGVNPADTEALVKPSSKAKGKKGKKGEKGKKGKRGGSKGSTKGSRKRRKGKGKGGKKKRRSRK